MRRPTRSLSRSTALAASLVLVAGVTAACGGEQQTVLSGATEGADAVTVSGDVGTSPTVEWKTQMTVPAEDVTVDTLAEGEGEALGDGDQALVNFWVGNGFTEKTLFDTFGADAAGFLYTVGGEPGQAATANDLVGQFLVTQIPDDVTRGTRLEITANAADVFGQNLYAQPVADAGVGNDDGLLIIADVLDTPILQRPQGTTGQPRESWAPRLQLGAGGKPTALNFDGVPAPNEQLRKTVVQQGTGALTAKGDVLVVNYLGQVYEGAKPFDQSYDRGVFSAGVGLPKDQVGVIQGWNQALVGVKVGSRVVLQVPPALGYGDQASGDIPANSTLYFVIDVLAAA